MLWLNALCAFLSAQEQTFYLEEWHATEGEQAESADRLVSVIDASSNLYKDFTVIKYNSGGTLQWAKLLDGAAGQDDEARAITVDSEGEEVEVNRTRSSFIRVSAPAPAFTMA